MPTARSIFLSLALACWLGGPRAHAAPQSNPNPANPRRVAIYVAGDGIMAPELLPGKPIELPPGKCKGSQRGDALLSFIVDEAGAPRNITFLSALGNDLDKFALRVVEADRFEPAMRNGLAAPAWLSAEVSMLGCIERSKDAHGKRIETLRPGAQPAQKFGIPPLTPPEAVLTTAETFAAGAAADSPQLEKVSPRSGVSAPVPLNNVSAIFSDEARKRKIQGICLVSLIVDRNGMPQNMRMVRGIGYGLDENALNAVSRYRFKPAMKNGVEPVPVAITIEISFRLY